MQAFHDLSQLANGIVLCRGYWPVRREDNDSILSNDDNEVFFKLYLLLYVDITVIFAESPEELQIALDTMKSYCDIWKLQLNVTKTKIVFSQKEKQGRNLVCLFVCLFL